MHLAAASQSSALSQLLPVADKAIETGTWPAPRMSHVRGECRQHKAASKRAVATAAADASTIASLQSQLETNTRTMDILSKANQRLHTAEDADAPEEDSVLQATLAKVSCPAQRCTGETQSHLSASVLLQFKQAWRDWTHHAFHINLQQLCRCSSNCRPRRLSLGQAPHPQRRQQGRCRSRPPPH